MADCVTAEAPSPLPEADSGGGAACSSRKEKRKEQKKLKRKQARRDAAIREREAEEARANDPEEQLRAELREKEEAETAEREQREFEERERLWLEAAAAREKAEEEAEAERRKKLLEEEQREKAEHENELEEGDDWEYIEEGPAEIIWQGNEIIVKKKRVRVAKRSAGQQTNKEDDDRPTSNPLPPQSVAFASYNNVPPISAQEVLESAAQQIPNFGTEQDKTHCPFHLKTGACRFGSRCSRVHFHPDKSCTFLIKNMYNGPGLAWEQDEGLEYTDEEVERYYEEFYEDVHTEFLKFGELVNFKVCRNGSYHLRGNVYVHYKSLESAILAYNTMNGRYFAGKQITCEFVGVTRWKVAICGEYMKSRLKTCSRGTACNFIHCFRNPGGDYEWADWDNPPPKHWIKKMAALFGPSDELAYDKNVGLEDWERPSDTSRKKTPTRNRHQSRRSLHDERSDQNSDSGPGETERYRHRSRRSLHSKRSYQSSDSGTEDTDRKREHWSISRECSGKRRKGTDILNAHRQSEEYHQSEVHDYKVKYSSHGHDSDEDSSKKNDRVFHKKHRKFDEHDSLKDHERPRRKHRATEEWSSKREASIDEQVERKRRRGEAWSGKREVSIDEQVKQEKKYKSKPHEWYDKEHTSDGSSDYADDNRGPSNGCSSGKSNERHDTDSQQRYDGRYCTDDLGSDKDSYDEKRSQESNFSGERRASERYNSHHKAHHSSCHHEQDHKKRRVRKKKAVDHEFTDDDSAGSWESKHRHSGRKRSCERSRHSRSGHSSRKIDLEESGNLVEVFEQNRDRQHKKHSKSNRKGGFPQENIEHKGIKEDISFCKSDKLELDVKARRAHSRSHSPVSHPGVARRERTDWRSHDS